MTEAMIDEELRIAALAEAELIDIAAEGLAIIYEQWDIVYNRVGEDIFDLIEEVDIQFGLDDYLLWRKHLK